MRHLAAGNTGARLLVCSQLFDSLATCRLEHGSAGPVAPSLSRHLSTVLAPPAASKYTSTTDVWW